MIHAYDKDYLPAAKENIAVMMDYAVTWNGLELRDFYNRFLSSRIDKAIESGHPKFLVGMSGIELAVRVVENTGGTLPYDDKYSFPLDDSSVFWTGWVLCQYQWYRGASFASIDRNGLPVEKVHELFHPLHEADITKVFDVFDTYYRPQALSLKECRKNAGLTQQALADRSTVSLRMIRAYEQGTQDLSRAEASTLVRLSKVLHCPIARLLGAD